MNGVYGTFIEDFQELYESFIVGDNDRWENERKVRAILMPSKGSTIKRRKYTSGNTGLDIKEVDEFYISRKYDSLVKIGDYVKKINDNIIMRLTGVLPYDKAAGYRIYAIEKVTGTTSDKDEELRVKEAVFA